MNEAQELLRFFEGATDIGFEIDGRADRDEIEMRFSAQQQSDREENEYEGIDDDPYTGDFTTVERVDFSFLDNTEFDHPDEAYEFALDAAKKWETVVAVYVTEHGETKTIVAGWGAE